MEDFRLTKYLSTKFILAVSSLGTGFYLVLTSHDIGAFTGLVATILGFYNGANVAQDYFHSQKEIVRTKVESNISPTPQVVINTSDNSNV